MVANIRRALAQVKDELPAAISRHVRHYLLEHAPGRWRVRELDPLTTVLLFVTQVLHGNIAINHLRRVAGMTTSATSYCQARMRLPLALFEYLCAAVTRELLIEDQEALQWRGHRVWLADGTGFSMPDTPELGAHFGRPSQQAPGCGFPVMTTLTLCNAAGFIIRTLTLPLRTHEASQIHRLHEHLQPQDVLVYDRAGCSYAHLALISQRDLHAIFRVHQKQIVSFRCGRKRGAGSGSPSSQWLQRLGKCDQLVRWFKPSNRPRWMTQEQLDALPDSMMLREVRFDARRKGFRSRSITLVTTLLEPRKYPATELAGQYLGRWDIELNFRHLKQTMKMDVLRCKSVEGVLKELAIFTLVYNMVRLAMLRAAQRQGVPLARISFIDALRWLCHSRADEQLLDLIVNPHRPGRIEPRVLKRRPKEFPLMKLPRDKLRQALIRGAVTA